MHCGHQGSSLCSAQCRMQVAQYMWSQPCGTGSQQCGSGQAGRQAGRQGRGTSVSAASPASRQGASQGCLPHLDQGHVFQRNAAQADGTSQVAWLRAARALRRGLLLLLPRRAAAPRAVAAPACTPCRLHRRLLLLLLLLGQRALALVVLQAEEREGVWLKAMLLVAAASGAWLVAASAPWVVDPWAPRGAPPTAPRRCCKLGGRGRGGQPRPLQKQRGAGAEAGLTQSQSSNWCTSCSSSMSPGWSAVVGVAGVARQVGEGVRAGAARSGDAAAEPAPAPAPAAGPDFPAGRQAQR